MNIKQHWKCKDTRTTHTWLYRNINNFELKNLLQSNQNYWNKLQQVISKPSSSYNNKSGLKLRIGTPIRAYATLEFLSVASTFETTFRMIYWFKQGRRRNKTSSSLPKKCDKIRKSWQPKKLNFRVWNGEKPPLKGNN